MGLSIGIGLAIASQKKNLNFKTFVLLGDGECNEGSVWEAAMAAPNLKIKNLLAIIDKNKFQQTGTNLDIKSLPGIYIGVVMGRHAGFLTAAASLGRKNQGDGPHLIYLPENNFSTSQFLSDVKKVYQKLGRCIVAVSEGIHDSKNLPIAAKIQKKLKG